MPDTLLGNFAEGAAVAFERRLFVAEPLPTLDDNVAVLPIELDAVADALGQLGCG